MSNTQDNNEKIAQLQNFWLERVFTPAFASTYNEKAAAVGLPPIQDAQTLNEALQLVGYINTVKAASVQSVNPINAQFNKLAGVQDNSLNTAYLNVVNDFSKAAASDPQLMSDLKNLLA